MKVISARFWRFLQGHSVRRNHFMSTLFLPLRPLPAKAQGKGHNALSTSQKLMIENGLIMQSSTGGAFHLLPLAIKSLGKIVMIIEDELSKYSCQKVQMPTLTSTLLWQSSGRLEESGKETIVATDRHSKQYLLSPTHEEAVCEILGDYPLSYKNLPLRLYQITNKFRDELRPRFGLLRSREFLMKDLYTFDTDEKTAMITYVAINEAYKHIFDRLGVKYVKVEGTSGMMGGNVSHEYHLLSTVGEDKLAVCSSCNYAFNEELHRDPLDSEQSELKICPKCHSKDLKKHLGIEVGHTFLLGSKYTKKFGSDFTNADGKSQVLEMGCYGIGVTRLLAGILEVLSTPAELRWPSHLAPYVIAIVPPKGGSKEEPVGKLLADELLKLTQILFPADVLVDDRTNLTIGKRVLELKKLGIPLILVFGKSLTEATPMVEVINVNNKEETVRMNFQEVQNFLASLRGLSLPSDSKDSKVSAS